MELAPHHKFVNALAFNAAGNKLASASDDNAVRVWNVDDTLAQSGNGRTANATRPNAQTELRCTSEALTVRWDPTNANVLVAAGSDRNLQIWDVRSRNSVHSVGTVTLPSKKNVNLAYHPRGHEIVVSSLEDTISVVDLRAQKVLRSETMQYEVNELAFNEDGSALFVASANGVDVMGKYPSLERTFNLNIGKSYTLCASPDGKTVAAGTYGSTVSLFETEELGCRLTLMRYDQYVKALSFSHDSRYLALFEVNGNAVEVTDAATGACVNTVVTPYARKIGAVAWSPVAHILAYSCGEHVFLNTSPFTPVVLPQTTHVAAPPMFDGRGMPPTTMMPPMGSAVHMPGVMLPQQAASRVAMPYRR